MPQWKEALRFFLGRYLSAHRGLSPRTQASYATALRLWLDWMRRGGQMRRPDQVRVEDVFSFLESLEEKRGNCVATRNLRWAALQSFWRAMRLMDAAHAPHYERLLQIPPKRCRSRSPDYLEPYELRRLFSLCDARTSRGFRDLVIFRYAYNTGSRISEIVEAGVAWLQFSPPVQVTIRGKGGKWRVCPLWESTAQMLRVYLDRKRPSPRRGYEDALFLNRLRKPWSRAGMWKLMRGYFRKAAEALPCLRHKRLSPHSLRHTTAIHLLRAGVDLTVIKAWLGHQDVSTTSRYLDLDLDQKREALEKFLKLDTQKLLGEARESRELLPASIVSWLERL